MSEIPYASIQPLIADQQVNGSSVRVTFRCPQSGFSVDSSAGIKKGQSLSDVAMASAKRSLWWSLRSTLLRMISSSLGHGVAGRVGRDVGNQFLRQAGQGVQYSNEEIQAAVVDAFTRVQSKFRHDGNQWTAAHGLGAEGAPVGDFQRQLQQAMPSEPYDRGVLARLLVEVAKADGQLAAEEERFLSTYLDPSFGTPRQLAQRPNLTAIELDETSAGAVRETLVMLGWALALSDQNLNPGEQARLDEVASGLKVAAGRAAELRSYAANFLVEQALEHAYPSGHRDERAHAAAIALAGKLGLSQEETERADVRFRKARGIV
ncbi:MAG TPA: hypothetical protein DEA08_30770 [Planctomycetes bacterium]|nr:hypothetical protein [Planctomycetota bacterium]